MEKKQGLEEVILELKGAGFEEKMIEKYLSCWREGKTAGQLRLLGEKREALLECVHEQEKQIGCLDYLVYQLRKETGKS